MFRAPALRGVTPGGRGRFDGYDTLDNIERWDSVTTGVVLDRLDPRGDFSFFTPVEQAVAGALFDLLLAQHEEPKVPVLSMVDHRLALDETDGWMYADMPEDREAWRATLAALDEDARKAFAVGFAAVPTADQAQLLQAVHDADRWHGWKASHVWSLWTRYACAAFYAHPWAWNEIGFGGPAYPRGYKPLGLDHRENWERQEADARDPVPWAQRVERATQR